MFLSLVIPVYNEEKCLAHVLDDCRANLLKCLPEREFEIIVIDDGSTDSSGAIARERKTRVIRHESRQGVGVGRTVGLKIAQGDFVMNIDADMTYDANDIPAMVEALKTNDMVVAARLEEAGTMPVLRALVKNGLRWLASGLAKRKIPDLNSGLRAMNRKKALEFLFVLPPGHSWVSTITLCFLASGYSVHYIPSKYFKRVGRSTFHVLGDTYNMFLAIMRTIVCFYPLRAFMPVSLAFFAVTALSIIHNILQWHITNTTVVCFVAGVVTFIFALLAEQVACLRREINQKNN